MQKWGIAGIFIGRFSSVACAPRAARRRHLRYAVLALPDCELQLGLRLGAVLLTLGDVVAKASKWIWGG